MAIETDEDRLIFVDPDDFGALAVWTSASGAKPAVSCIFDDTFIALSAGDLDLAQEGGRVQITLRSSDVPGDAAHEDAIEITGDVLGTKTFTVLEFQPDGTGMTVVRLQEA
ncbi:hypothetical protein M728_000381 [Ensifer sp. WSM1721]|uniref:head-tail joining protein n=1 Tax=Ensifer sp. WSM1721 TaxID=1041159 RepID=UPI0004799B36|nr:hypothetical protein [Ensifer sp. WSM1721]